MTTAIRSTLVFGYGNPGRRDDGLGPALAEAVAVRDIEGVTVEIGYQLQVEDALAVAKHDVVIFADAEVDAPAAFSFRPLEPAREIAFTTHAVPPEGVLSVARDLFGARTRAYLLGIRGEDFDGLGEGLSAAARSNLDAALAFLVPMLERGLVDSTSTVAGPTPSGAVL